MHCTIVICTRDRAALLETSLESLTRLAVPERMKLDVLVVDNGSSDGTADVVASFRGRLDIARVFEPEGGLSIARNTGVKHATGEYILWTDDDVFVDRGWLQAYAAAFAAYPDAAVFGGKVSPMLEEPAPKWFEEARNDLHFLLATRDFGADRPLSVPDDCIPYGANYAIKTDAQRRYAYDPELGVAPGRRRGGEETALIKQMLTDGLEGRWVSGAEVVHLIPHARQTIEYVARFYSSMGEAWAFPRLRGRRRIAPPLSTCLKIPLAYTRLKWAELFQPKARIRFLASFSYHSGVLRSFLQHARPTSRSASRPA